MSTIVDRYFQSLAERLDQVVLLDEGRVVEPRAVVLRPAAAHGVLLEVAPAGRRLPRVEHSDLKAPHGVDEPARVRRDSRKDRSPRLRSKIFPSASRWRQKCYLSGKLQLAAHR